MRIKTHTLIKELRKCADEYSNLGSKSTKLIESMNLFREAADRLEEFNQTKTENQNGKERN